MTRKLEELFNLPAATENASPEEIQQVLEENRDIITAVDTAIDKVDAALPSVKNLDTADSELDELADIAKKSAQDLLDLGMQVEARFSGTIFQTAGTLLGHAITAKQAKLDKKLRMVNLQLQKAKFDHQVKKDAKAGAADAEEVEDGQGVVLDRNALLAQILGKGTDSK
jgi:hypothetical protein